MKQIEIDGEFFPLPKKALKVPDDWFENATADIFITDLYGPRYVKTLYFESKNNLTNQLRGGKL